MIVIGVNDCARWRSLVCPVGRTQHISDGGQKVASGHEAAADVQAVGLQIQHQTHGLTVGGHESRRWRGKLPTHGLLRDSGFRLNLAQGDAAGRAAL